MRDPGAIHVADDFSGVAVAPREIAHRQLDPRAATVLDRIAEDQTQYAPQLGLRVAAAQAQVLQLAQPAVAPALEKADNEFRMIAEVPIETAARYNEPCRQRQHAHVVESAFRGGGGWRI